MFSPIPFPLSCTHSSLVVVFQVPDYAEVIKQPMDLSTVLSKIDRHQYETVKEFLYDVDLIWQNALEYNPDRDPSGTQRNHQQNHPHKKINKRLL